MFTIVYGWLREGGGEENLPLCVTRTQQERDLLLLFEFVTRLLLCPGCRYASSFDVWKLPPSTGTCEGSSQAGRTATPGLLLTMRANVRLVSMNIDVEDRLVHRTEGGKMAAL